MGHVRQWMSGRHGVPSLRMSTWPVVSALRSWAAALLAAHSGVIDSHGLMQALLGGANAHGAALALALSSALTEVTR